MHSCAVDDEQCCESLGVNVGHSQADKVKGLLHIQNAATNNPRTIVLSNTCCLRHSQAQPHSPSATHAEQGEGGGFGRGREKESIGLPLGLTPVPQI